MARVFVTRRLPEGGTDPLLAAGHQVLGRDDDRAPSADELVAAARTADAIVCLLGDRIDGTVLRAGASGTLRVVANVAVGFDNVDIAAAADHGIVVCNTPGVLEDTTADLTFLLILAAARRAHEAASDLRAGLWDGWGINQYLGADVFGATLGLVGYGRIGRAVARRAHGFAMSVLHHCRRATGEAGYVADLETLLRQSDIVSLHVPLTPETHHLIDAGALALMKRTAVLVNTARGPVVDEAALAGALHAGRIFAAGLDVFEHEPAVDAGLLSTPRAVLLPHIASASQATRTKMARLACAGAVAVLAGTIPPNAIETTVPGAGRAP